MDACRYEGSLLMPRRSSRPLTNKLEKLSIQMLKEWDLLRLGCYCEKEFENGLVIATDLSGRQQTCRLGRGKDALVLRLESRRLGRGLVWYFKDPMSGALCAKLFRSNGILASRKSVGALYVSQFQHKIFRTILRMQTLIIAIDGDGTDGIRGPGRGSRKLKNVDQLRQKMSEIVANKESLEKVLQKNPWLQIIPLTAMTILRRELVKLPRGWVAFDRLQKMSAHNIYDLEDRL
jgi:hypothetical protein